jgi:membrane fusion protein (multidrug efflux system)
MRIATQLAVLAVLGAAGTAWHFYGEQFGLPRPLALVGLEQPRAVAARPPNAGAGPGQGIGVVVSPVRTGTVTERVESVGTARAREAVTVTARVSGIVSRILFEEGQAVPAGATLVELDTAQQQAELDQARAALDDARQGKRCGCPPGRQTGQ